jgi:NAD(P)-dependent dehydrogenase (short-subunit alcohol dehydrogenase family)
LISDFDLEGKVALVTGASRGIGRACSRAFAEAGARVALGARSTDDLEHVAGEVRDAGGEAVHAACDVRDPSEVGRLVELCSERLGPPDILVANAGISVDGVSAEEITEAQWRDTLATNLDGCRHVCLAAGPTMAERGGGSIITVASVEALTAAPGGYPYVVSKHGILGLTRALAVEWGRRAVRVNAVCPGFIRRDVEPLADDPETTALIDSRTALGRWGESREVSLAVLFLASSASSYVTGAALPVDGGWLAS